MSTTFVYGPVPSRRLGWSLGVDLVPYKTCTYDCIYCQLSRTTHQTLDRKEYVSTPELLDGVERALAVGGERRGRPLDWIGLAGSGEPTLHSHLGEVIAAIKRMTNTPVAVLTNGSLLWSPSVREELAEADLVLPSLDAGDEASFRYVNRPHPDLGFEQMVQGLVDLRREFSKPIWLEVFLLGGVTDVPADAQRIADLARKIGADRVQLNSVTRPPCESFALPVSCRQLEALRPLFGDRAEVIPSRRAHLPEVALRAPGEQELFELLRRRPCTLADLCQGLGLNPAETAKTLERMLTEGRVRERVEDSRRFYVPGPEGGIDGPSGPLET